MAGIRLVSALIFTLLITTTIVFAEEQELTDINLKTSQENFQMKESFGSINITLVVQNPTDKSYTIFIAKSGDDSKLETMKQMGKAEPKFTTKIHLTIKTQYDGKKSKSLQYQLLLYDDEGNLKRLPFSVVTDWEPYEKSVGNQVSLLYWVAVPIFAILSVIAIVATLRHTHKFQVDGICQDEFTDETLFFPALHGRPYLEKIADVLSHPLFWTAEALCVVLLLSWMLSTSKESEPSFMIFVLSGFVAFFFPFCYLAIDFWFENFNRKPFRMFFGMFAWGAFSAFLAFILNYTKALGLGLISSQEQDFTIVIISTAVIAPLIEEIVKGFGVYSMAGHHEAKDILTGFRIGFACGVGFSFVENWFYFATKTSPFEMGLIPWGIIMLYRTFFNCIGHGIFTGACGTIIMYLKNNAMNKNIRQNISMLVAAVVVSTLLHLLFNITAIFDGYVFSDSDLPFFIFNPSYTLILLAAMAIFVYHEHTENKKHYMFNLEGNRNKKMFFSLQN